MFSSFFKRLFFGRQAEEQEIKLQHEAKEIILKANEEAFRIKTEAEHQAQKNLAEALEVEKRIATERQQIDEKEKLLNTEKGLMEKEKQSLADSKKSVEEKRDQILQKLEAIAQMTKDQAKQLLLQGWEEKLKSDIARRITQAEEDLKRTVDEKAKHLLVDAMRYGATDVTAEYTLSVVHLPSDEFKGRIIGKEGRNIRAFEVATGVDVDLEDCFFYLFLCFCHYFFNSWWLDTSIFDELLKGCTGDFTSYCVK